MVEGTLPKILNSKTQSWRLILPWVYTGFIASFFLFMLLFIFWISPETFTSIFHGDVGHRTFRIPFPFGTLNPLSPLTVRILSCSSITYWGIGLMLSWPRFRSYSDWRSTCSNISLNLAIAGLFFLIPMLVTVWFLAIEGGNIPSGPWGIYEGNHGPWRHVYDLRKLLSYTIFVPICSFVLGLISLMLRATKLTGVILTASVLSFLLLMYSHYWLID